jgi:hypothetical protein
MAQWFYEFCPTGPQDPGLFVSLDPDTGSLDHGT